MNHLTVGLGTLIAFIVAGLVWTSKLALAATAKEPPSIPAAAAAEANIVCTSFSGLDTFVVAPMPPASASEGNAYARYRVTATCKSQHTVTGIIELKMEERT